jgi:hypothetical protein
MDTWFLIGKHGSLLSCNQSNEPLISISLSRQTGANYRQKTAKNRQNWVLASP